MADDPNALPEQGDMLTDSGASLGLSLRGARMNIRVPDESERLLLSEEQVDYLCRGGKDHSFDWCLALGGASLGFLQNVVIVASNVYNGKISSVTNMVLAGLCVFCLAASIAKYTEYRSKKGNVEVLLEKIRAGRKVSVS